MREITKFVADNGKEFEDFVECQQYELAQKVSTFPAGAFNMFDQEGKHTNSIVDAYYIVSNSYHASKYIWELADFEGYSCPDVLENGEIGRWFYDPSDDEWVSFDELEEFYKNVKKIFS